MVRYARSFDCAGKTDDGAQIVQPLPCCSNGRLMLNPAVCFARIPVIRGSAKVGEGRVPSGGVAAGASRLRSARSVAP